MIRNKLLRRSPKDRLIPQEVGPMLEIWTVCSQLSDTEIHKSLPAFSQLTHACRSKCKPAPQ